MKNNSYKYSFNEMIFFKCIFNLKVQKNYKTEAFHNPYHYLQLTLRICIIQEVWGNIHVVFTLYPQKLQLKVVVIKQLAKKTLFCCHLLLGATSLVYLPKSAGLGHINHVISEL